MKYCPYCGAALFGGAAAFCVAFFCVECGKPIPTIVEPVCRKRETQNPFIMERRQRPGRATPSDKRQKPANHKQSREKTVHKKRRDPPARKTKRPELVHVQKPDTRDEGYDGYYDDVIPIDFGKTVERTDSELFKRIAIIASGAVGVIILSVILMYLL